MFASESSSSAVEPSLFEFIKKDSNGLLLATAVVSGALLLWPFVRRSTGGPWVSAAQATLLINREDALVVDVRDQGEYDAGHILGAKHFPLARLESGEISKKKSQPLIVYCEGGQRSQKAAAALRRQGYERVVSLNGGLGAWQQAGLPEQK
jgi:rhodanese-related sulfurtransferase